MPLSDRWNNSNNRLRLFVLVIGLVVVLSSLPGQAQDAANGGGAPATQTGGAPPAIPSLWDLAVQGGLFMIPIGLASIVVIAFTLERMIGLRTAKVLPPDLILGIRDLDSTHGIDPREAYNVCQQHESPLANALRAAILKVGRPHAELEKAVEDAVGRETADMARNLRPINVVATIAPLLGLIGTVQGMIQAFMVISSTTSTGTAKAQELAHGIYTALVTTFAGLVVAVIAVLLANFLEGRLERLLREMEALFLDIIPQFERYEGKLRVARTQGDDSSESGILLKGTQKKQTSRPAAESEEASAGRPRGLWGVMGEPETPAVEG